MKVPTDAEDFSRIQKSLKELEKLLGRIREKSGRENENKLYRQVWQRANL